MLRDSAALLKLAWEIVGKLDATLGEELTEKAEAIGRKPQAATTKPQAVTTKPRRPAANHPWRRPWK